MPNIPKAELSRQAAASGNALKSALQLPDSEKSKHISSQIAALADKGDVVVEWSAHEINRGAAAASSCCCCCCCCHESAAVSEERT